MIDMRSLFSAYGYSFIFGDTHDWDLGHTMWLTWTDRWRRANPYADTVRNPFL